MKKEVAEPLTIYTVNGKNSPTVWRFSYTLEGYLRRFEVVDGVLTEQQMQWLFSKNRFPYTENGIKGWQKAIKNLEVEVGAPDLSFEYFYNYYGYKMSPKPAEKAWKKTSEANKLLALKQIKPYKNFLKRKHQEQAYPATYLNQELYLSQFKAY